MTEEKTLYEQIKSQRELTIYLYDMAKGSSCFYGPFGVAYQESGVYEVACPKAWGDGFKGDAKGTAAYMWTHR